MSFYFKVVSKVLEYSKDSLIASEGLALEAGTALFGTSPLSASIREEDSHLNRKIDYAFPGSEGMRHAYLKSNSEGPVRESVALGIAQALGARLPNFVRGKDFVLSEWIDGGYSREAVLKNAEVLGEQVAYFEFLGCYDLTLDNIVFPSSGGSPSITDFGSAFSYFSGNPLGDFTDGLFQFKGIPKDFTRGLAKGRKKVASSYLEKRDEVALLMEPLNSVSGDAYLGPSQYPDYPHLANGASCVEYSLSRMDSLAREWSGKGEKRARTSQ